MPAAAPAPAGIQPPAAPAPSSARPAPSGRPAWQRNGVFRFLSSVKLAVVLLAVVIVASIFGTIYESRFDADVARAYVYGAAWFNLWLLLLVVNLAASAFSRWPWQRRHVGFLVTHLGIIVLLAGAFIGRLWGVEGTMTLFKGRAANSRLFTSERRLYLIEGDEARTVAFPVRVLGRRPTPEWPWTLGETPGGWRVQLVDHVPKLAATFQPAPASADQPNASPAAQVRLVSKRLNRTMDAWLLADSPEHSTFDLGLASVLLRRGPAPAAAEPAATDARPATMGTAVDEMVFAFAQHPDQPLAQAVNGGAPSGATVRLLPRGERRVVQISWRGATWELDADADRGKDEDLSGSGLHARILDYYPDFLMKDGRPATASAEPRNPAVVVSLHGNLPATESADATAATPAAPAAGGGGNPGNAAVVFLDGAGTLSYSLQAGGGTPVRGTLGVGQTVNTGWADWTLSVLAALPRAVEQTRFEPLPANAKTPPPAAAGPGNRVVEGVRVRLSRPGRPAVEQWAAFGLPAALPGTGQGPAGQPLQLVFGQEFVNLPIGLQLTDFEVERNEGTNDPAGFRSSLLATDRDGRTGTGACWMNNPFNFPGQFWNTWTGMTWKISQAQYTESDLSQSTVQILRDPGWLLKWVGSLLVCAGIFTLFYLRPAARLTAESSKSEARSSKQVQSSK